MSYAIATFIYGVPLTPEIISKVKELGLEIENSGFTRLYSSSDGQPGYCGVQLTDSDECQDYVRFSDLKTRPELQDKLNVRDKLQALHPEIKALINEPDVYIIWNNS